MRSTTAIATIHTSSMGSPNWSGSRTNSTTSHSTNGSATNSS